MHDLRHTHLAPTMWHLAWRGSCLASIWCSDIYFIIKLSSPGWHSKKLPHNANGGTKWSPASDQCMTNENIMMIKPVTKKNKLPTIQAADFRFHKLRLLKNPWAAQDLLWCNQVTQMPLKVLKKHSFHFATREPRKKNGLTFHWILVG